MDSSNSQVAIRQENRISTTGYHASPKRQKLSTEDNNELQSNMMKLPTEMIVKLCGYFTNQDLSEYISKFVLSKFKFLSNFFFKFFVCSICLTSWYKKFKFA